MTSNRALPPPAVSVSPLPGADSARSPERRFEDRIARHGLAMTFTSAHPPIATYFDGMFTAGAAEGSAVSPIPKRSEATAYAPTRTAGTVTLDHERGRHREWSILLVHLVPERDFHARGRRSYSLCVLRCSILGHSRHS